MSCVGAQIGGSDQWGNITAGTELARKILGGEEGDGVECYGLTFPLLVSQGSYLVAGIRTRTASSSLWRQQLVPI